jgi:hypothetical protein
MICDTCLVNAACTKACKNLVESVKIKDLINKITQRLIKSGFIFSIKSGKNIEVNVESNRIAWYKNELLHREDGPAVEYYDGHKEWWKNGLLHREDGPAVDYYDRHKEWWKNGLLHREDGPAIEYYNGNKEWWKNGIIRRNTSA